MKKREESKDNSYVNEFKILLLGDSSPVKIALTKKFCYNIFNPSERLTIGVDFYFKTLELDGKKIKLQLWDAGGEERFRFLLPTYIRGSNGALFIYDITNYSSLAHIDDWLMVIREEFPIVVVGNKADLIDDREVSVDEGINIAKSRGTDGFIECSSKTGENVEEVFSALARLMMKRSGLIEK